MNEWALPRNHREGEYDEPPMMDCGHAANGLQVLEDGTKIPVCIIHAITDPSDRALGTRVVETPDLSDRKARCSYFGRPPHRNESNYGCMGKALCECEVDSKSSLPFFSHNLNQETDEFYCGCWGWD